MRKRYFKRASKSVNKVVFKAQNKPLPLLNLYHYKSKEIMSLIGALGFFVVAVLINSDPQASNGGLSGIVPLIFIIGLGYALFVDSTGVVTLRGAMRWVPMSPQRKVAVGCSWFFLFPFYLFYYLVNIIFDSCNSHPIANAEQSRYSIANAEQSRYPIANAEQQEYSIANAEQFATAHLESKLGMMPIVEGECEHCHHPLIFDATFCTYCGKETHPKAKVCSSCATLAPPDARYCPKCRTALM